MLIAKFWWVFLVVINNFFSFYVFEMEIFKLYGFFFIKIGNITTFFDYLFGWIYFNEVFLCLNFFLYKFFYVIDYLVSNKRGVSIFQGESSILTMATMLIFIWYVLVSLVFYWIDWIDRWNYFIVLWCFIFGDMFDWNSAYNCSFRYWLSFHPMTVIFLNYSIKNLFTQIIFHIHSLHIRFLFDYNFLSTIIFSVCIIFSTFMKWTLMMTIMTLFQFIPDSEDFFYKWFFITLHLMRNSQIHCFFWYC